MMIPVLEIARHERGQYEWAISYGNERHYGEDGLSSITTCLSHAVLGLQTDDLLVELRYRAVAMGTVSRRILEEAPEVIAEKIANDYGILVACM